MCSMIDIEINKVCQIKDNDIEKIIQFIYLGEVSVTHAGVDKFLRTAKFLGLSQLSDQCTADLEELDREFSIGKFDEVKGGGTLEEIVDYQTEKELEDIDSNAENNDEDTENEDIDEYGIRINEDYKDGSLQENENDTSGDNKEADTNYAMANFDETEMKEITSTVNEIDNDVKFTV